MAYREEEQVRLRRQSSKQAVTLAMQGHWQEAIAANKVLLESFPNDVDAYNRLGRAYLELGEYAQSKEAYGKALELDAYNTIAKKNLERLAHLAEEAGAADASHKVEPHHFIEDTGKAGVVKLSHLAPQNIIARLVSGDIFHLKIDGSRLLVENDREENIGQVEPRHAQRLIRLMEGGNRYSAALVSATLNGVTVIIRETYQDPAQAGKFSFPPRGVERGKPYYGGDRFIRRDARDEELEEELEYAASDEGEYSEEPIDAVDRTEEE